MTPPGRRPPAPGNSGPDHSRPPILVVEALQNVSDEQLAQRSQAEDWASFDELVRRYEARIYRFALSYCGHEADARELTQETFVSVHQHLRKYDPTRSFTTWIFIIARRKCIDRGRRPRRDFANELPDLPDANDPAVLLGRREAAEELWQTARRVLSDTQFQTLWLHYVEDLGVREVARVMRRTQPHVKVLLFRARQVLADELGRAAVVERSQSHRSRAGQVSVPMPAVSPASSNSPHL